MTGVIYCNRFRISSKSVFEQKYVKQTLKQHGSVQQTYFLWRKGVDVNKDAHILFQVATHSASRASMQSNNKN
jgi:hypothetical protein